MPNIPRQDNYDLLLQNTRETATGLRVAAEMLTRLDERMTSMGKSMDSALMELRGGPEGSLTTRLAVLEQREHNLEGIVEREVQQREAFLQEHRTRVWQVWLCLVGAVLSATGSVVIALVKLKT